MYIKWMSVIAKNTITYNRYEYVIWKNDILLKLSNNMYRTFIFINKLISYIN